jgi:hypothetical protein
MVGTVAMNVGEQFAAAFCARYGLHVERFAKTEMRSGKTPDFRIFKADQLVLYCEAKHVQYDEWLDKRLEQAQPLEIVGGLRIVLELHKWYSLRARGIAEERRQRMGHPLS